jgi:hypothetical protein
MPRRKKLAKRLASNPKLNPKRMLAMKIRLGEGFVREGLLPLDQLTDEELDKTFSEAVWNFLKLDDFDTALTFDHTPRLLNAAVAAENEHDLELCSLFYMLWIEHRVNMIARVMLRRRSVPDDQAVTIIRKLSVREKLTALWRVLGLNDVDPEVIRIATVIEEFRNAFVHFKWPSFPDLRVEDRTWLAINEVKRVVHALWDYEEIYIYYGQRERIAESAARLK